ncbi:methyltransferase domain-containing protein [Desulfovibrio sp. JC010]|uniref:methyltransferase domain-containing protein n=1 Tax=Desulfovibrio sp. JC010 TaxID=2593641 RepID=UPI0013D29595|nr:methyltransferase domain-containing protein [Desulfovibrio sp. JC010]NDV27779.1 methyltransferase domain-containing protein [Desulfovibrio sp. JC010]
MTRNAELKKIVAEVGEDLIWRPLYDFEQTRLAQGVGDDIDGIDPEFKELDFTDKTVCDLGCNMGHFSFYASERGAVEVVGYDLEPKVVSGAKKLARLYGVDNVDFKVCNFAYDDPEQTFDMGMLIDILGKINIGKGHMTAILLGLEKRSESEMLLTFRPEYYVQKHFGLTEDYFLELYPEAEIRDGLFSLLDFAKALFVDKWDMDYLSRPHPDDEQYKRTVHFKRR